MQQANRQKIGIFIIIIGLLILIAIIYFGFFRNKAAVTETPAVSTTTNQIPAGAEATTTTEIARAQATYDLSKEAPHQVNANDVAKIAETFAARFGSYSNQSSYNNFIDLKIFMTANMQDWADKNVSDLKASSTNTAAYYGITTNALTSEIKKFDDASGAAQIVVTTNRQENTEAVNPGKNYVQKLDLDFKKVNGAWLVDRAYWEK